jgi:hypothetical protein
MSRCLAELRLMNNLQALIKRGIMMIQKLEENGEMSLKRSFVTWINNKFGRSLTDKIFQRIEEILNVNGSSR